MPRTPPFLNRYFLHPLEAIAALFVYFFFRSMPFTWASAVGGWIGHTLGPRLKVTERARRNLRRAMPELAEEEISRIVRGMWDNLGRTAGEYPHLSTFNVYDPAGPVEVVGIEHIDLLRNDGKPGIFFSAHIGNWEVISLATTHRGMELDRIYRAANNRFVEWLYRQGRKSVSGALAPKGTAGARMILKSLRSGSHLGIMADQKLNEGIAVPFFGHDAMTAPALAEFALRFDCPVVPARCRRLAHAKLRIEVSPPIEIAPTGDREKDVAAIMADVNSIIEGWVRDTPEQWLWLHNRWPD